MIQLINGGFSLFVEKQQEIDGKILHETTTIGGFLQPRIVLK